MRSDTAPSTHTHFFRDEPQLVAVVDALATKPLSLGTARVWSAGCSTGAEAYSLAMLCAERDVPVHIVATDFADEPLAIGRAGRYSEHSLRHVSSARRARFLEPIDGQFVVASSILDAVHFVHADLFSATRSDVDHTNFDAIVCRNVMIYYDAHEASQLLQRLAQRLAPGGAIYLGASDHFTFRQADVPLSLRHRAGQVVYVSSGDARVHVRPSVPAPVVETPVPVCESFRQDEIARRVRQGFEHIVKHAFEAAERLLDDALRLDPTAPEPYYYLGLLRRKQGRHREAAEALRRAHLLAPDFWPASFLIAGAWDRLGQHELATQARLRVASQIRRGAGVGTFHVADGDPLFDARAALAACEPAG